MRSGEEQDERAGGIQVADERGGQEVAEDPARPDLGLPPREAPEEEEEQGAEDEEQDHDPGGPDQEPGPPVGKDGLDPDEAEGEGNEKGHEPQELEQGLGEVARPPGRRNCGRRARPRGNWPRTGRANRSSPG